MGTITSLQTEVNELKKQKQNSTISIANNVSSSTTPTVQKASNIIQAPQQQKTENLDPLDMFFGGGTVSNSNEANKPKADVNIPLTSQNNGGDKNGNEFGSWATF